MPTIHPSPVAGMYQSYSDNNNHFPCMQPSQNASLLSQNSAFPLSEPSPPIPTPQRQYQIPFQHSMSTQHVTYGGCAPNSTLSHQATQFDPQTQAWITQILLAEQARQAQEMQLYRQQVLYELQQSNPMTPNMHGYSCNPSYSQQAYGQSIGPRFVNDKQRTQEAVPLGPETSHVPSNQPSARLGHVFGMVRVTDACSVTMGNVGRNPYAKSHYYEGVEAGKNCSVHQGDFTEEGFLVYQQNRPGRGKLHRASAQQRDGHDGRDEQLSKSL